MALNVNSSSIVNEQAAQAQVQQQTNQVYKQKTAQEPEYISSFHDDFYNPGASFADDYCEKVVKVFTDLASNVKQGLDTKVLYVSNRDQKTYYSVVIVATRAAKVQEIGVAYYALLIERSADRPSAFVHQNGGRSIEEMRTAALAFDQDLLKVVAEQLSYAYPGLATHFSLGCVIPASVDAQDLLRLGALFNNAVEACYMNLLSIANQQPKLNLAMIQKDGNLQLRPEYARTIRHDKTGQPMRADFTLMLESVQGGQQRNQSLNKAARMNRPVTSVCGYVDVLWSPAEPVQTMPGYPMMQPTQKYAARQIITDFNCLSNNMYFMLLGLATASTMSENNQWWNVFRPIAGSRDQIDLHDVGVLNVEANVISGPNGALMASPESGMGQPLDTKTANFDGQLFYAYMNALFRPGLAMAIDVPEMGPQSWYLDTFNVAANPQNTNSPGHLQAQQAATQEILEAADVLTAGNFGRMWGELSMERRRIFVQLNERIHMGTWRDTHGNVRDLRDFDHLAVLNLMWQRDPSAGKEWSDTFLRTNNGIAERLQARKRMIDMVSRDTADYCGFAQRLTFTSDFISTLSRAVRATGVDVRPMGQYNIGEQDNARGQATWVNQALVNSASAFNYTGGGVGAYNPYMGVSVNRYGQY